MKKIIGAVVGLALLAACSDRAVLSKVEDPSQRPGESGGNAETGSSASALNTVEVRLRATGAEGYSQLIVVPDRITVTADGMPLEVAATWSEVDLANMGHAEKLATVELPEGAKQVHFRVELAAAGGFTSGAASGWVDSGGSVLEFDVSGAELARTKRAVVMLDATRSFVPRDVDQLVLVPNFRVD